MRDIFFVQPNIGLNELQIIKSLPLSQRFIAFARALHIGSRLATRTFDFDKICINRMCYAQRLASPRWLPTFPGWR
jgi:hypothetical protein